MSSTGSRAPATRFNLGWIPPADAALAEAETLVKESDVARGDESREVTFTLGSDELPKAAVEVSVGGGQPMASTPHLRGRL